MKKSVFGRKLKRDKNERAALFKGLMSALVLKDRIQTSEAKAKAIRPEMERLVTKALKNSTAASRIIAGSLNANAVEKFVKDVAPRFKDRKGGYTRIIKIGRRFGDKSPVVILEWVEMSKAVATLPVSKEAKKEIKTAKKTVRATRKPAVKKPVAKKAAAKPRSKK